MRSQNYDICVIGGGAAGIMAAITAAKDSSLRVALIEKNDILGRKILATGNGRCNLTNINASAIDYFGANRDFINKIMTAFPPIMTINYFNDIGVITKEEDRGRIFPRSNQAKTVMNALKEELQNHNITILLNHNIKNIEQTEAAWKLSDEKSRFITTKKLILTTGGRAAHQFGSNGDGLFWLNKKFNIKVVSPHAALVPINAEFKYLKDLMGIKLETNLTLIKNGSFQKATSGEMIFTHFGISGPAAMSLGREINGDNDYRILIDLLPEISDHDFEVKIRNLTEVNGTKSIKNILAGFLPDRLAEIICRVSEINPLQKTAEISKSDRLKLIRNTKNFELVVKDVRPLKEAQVTAGGIDISEIDSNTLKLKRLSNLFVAGEIIDVDGKSGGYNLQWAWSSGYLAGQSALKEVLNEARN